MPGSGEQIRRKLEGTNPTGSCKDRMAVSVLRRALARGALRPGDPVVKYTCGSTGLNVVAAIDLAADLTAGSRIVTLGSDTGAKYLGGDL